MYILKYNEVRRVTLSVNWNHFLFQAVRNVKMLPTILFCNSFPTKSYMTCLHLFTSIYVNSVKHCSPTGNVVSHYGPLCIFFLNKLNTRI